MTSSSLCLYKDCNLSLKCAVVPVFGSVNKFGIFQFVFNVFEIGMCVMKLLKDSFDAILYLIEMVCYFIMNEFLMIENVDTYLWTCI